MYQATDFKKKVNNDYFRNKVYYFDNFISSAIKSNIILQQSKEMRHFVKQQHKILFNIKNSIELTNKILALEHIPNCKVYENNNINQSECNFNYKIITFCSAHLNDQEIAFHEMAHLIDILFSIDRKPAHHVGFLSALEYLLDKYGFLSKNVFQSLVNKFNFDHKGKVPYIKDYYQVSTLNYKDYIIENEVIFKKCIEEEDDCYELDHDDFQNYNDPKIVKRVYSLNDHYIVFIKNIDYPYEITKVIVKKLGFELKTETKIKDILISPRYALGHNLTKATSKKHIFFSGYSIDLFNKELNFEDIKEAIENEFTDLRDYQFEIKSKPHCKSIIVAFDHEDFESKKINGFIKRIKDILKTKNISYYQAKTEDEFYRYEPENKRYL